MDSVKYRIRTAGIAGKYLRVCFPDNDFTAKKQLQHVSKKHDGVAYLLPLEKRYVEELEIMNFEFSNGLKKWINEIRVTESRKVTVKNIPKLGGTLYPYQLQGVNFIDRKNGRALIADEMGLGKTVQALAWLQLRKPDCLPALVICPSSLKINWEREAEKWTTGMDIEVLFGQTPKEIEGNLIIINYDVLPYWMEELKRIELSTIIADECFPEGTKILTPNGFKNIEDINVGDTVYNALGTGKVENIGVRKDYCIKLHLSNGNSIKVTPNHLFFTDDGWIPAKNLLGKNILDKSNIFYILSNSLEQKIFDYEKEKITKKMRMVRKRVPSNLSQKKILQHILLSEMENEPTRNKRKVIISRKIRKNKYCIKKSTCKKPQHSKNGIFANEGKQSNAQYRDGRENERNFKIKRTLSTNTNRRQWSTITKTTKSPLGSFRYRVGSRIPYQNKTTQKFGIPNLLQSRYSFAKSQNMDRSRWVGTHFTKNKTKGQEKRKLTESIRVERITFPKRGNNEEFGKSTVYNLQVSGHPSYYAEGFLVHNCHYIKNNKALRTKAFKRLVKTVPYLVALTGTPIENRPIEIFNILFALDNNIFPNYFVFTKRYCGAKPGAFGWDVNGASNTGELNRILTDTVMIRRKKKDVLKELPAKQIAKVTLEINNRLDYQKAENEFIQYLKDRFQSYSTDLDDQVKKELRQYAKDHEIEIEDEELSANDLNRIKQEKIKGAKNAPMFAKIETLKQLAVQGKLDQIIDWIETFLESDEKLVVFAIHRKVIDTLTKHFPEAVKIDGSVSMSNRQKAVDAFQSNPKVRLLIGNIKAAGVGITLTAASNVAIIQFPWSPGELVQASDRVHRISQTKQVTIWHLVGKNTIEEKIIDILVKKEKVINEVLDGEFRENESILGELIKSYRK